METKLTNYNVLVWGMKHIANNYHLDYGEEDMFGATSHYILNLTSQPSVPQLSDIKMLAEDLNMTDNLDTSTFGCEILITDNWKNTIGQQPYTNPNPLWKRYNTPLLSKI